MIASLKSDKESLESTLYEAQQLNAMLDTRKEQLEGENQELILKKENLQGKTQTSYSLQLKFLWLCYLTWLKLILYIITWEFLKCQ